MPNCACGRCARPPPALSRTVLGGRVRDYKLNAPGLRHSLGPLPFVDSELLSRPDADAIIPPLGGSGASDYRVSGPAPCAPAAGPAPWAQPQPAGASVSSGLRYIKRQA